MACAVLHPAGAAPAPALWSRLLLLPVPLPRRRPTTKELPHRIPCMDQFQRKLPFNDAWSYRSCFTSSGSSAELAALSRPADVSGAHSDPSMRRCTDSVPGALVIISGYWTGPDVDDGSGSVEAVLQRIG